MSGGLLGLLPVILAGAAVGLGGVVLLLFLDPGLRPQRASTAGGGVARWRVALGAARRRTVVAVLVGLAAFAFTRWIVAGAAGAALVLLWPALVGGAAAERRAAARVEGLAVWTESLRDTIAGAVGLEQAIVATAGSAPSSIAPQLASLADRLRVRVPLPTALLRLAEDLDDASADLVVAALLLNARLRGPGLRQVLGSLSNSIREELEMRGRVTAARASVRRSVQIVVGVTVLFVLGLVTFNPEYVEPYRYPAGQVVLLVIVGLFAAGFAWLRRLSGYDLPGRFLTRTGEES